MWRSALAVVACSIQPVPAQVPSSSATDAAAASDCAQIIEQESSGWEDTGAHMDRFSLKVAVHNWEPHARVTLTLSLIHI